MRNSIAYSTPHPARAELGCAKVHSAFLNVSENPWSPRDGVTMGFSTMGTRPKERWACSEMGDSQPNLVILVGKWAPYF
jgi:hypothetical protein